MSNLLRYYKPTVEAPSSINQLKETLNVCPIVSEPPEPRELPKLESDPGLRPCILDYHPNIRDDVRRAYLANRPCQPKNHNFPQTMMDKMRRFTPSWYEGCESWLEYSIAKDKIYCLYCYLFKPQSGGVGDAFSNEGYNNWRKKKRLRVHVGEVNSAHNLAATKARDVMKPRQSIAASFSNYSAEEISDYRVRLNASVDCIRFLLQQGHAFRGHDESEESLNRGNFLELLTFLCDHDENVRAVALKNAPENLKLISPRIQKDIVNACAQETSLRIMKDLGNKKFSLLVDECRDLSIKEQMAIVIRYVNDQGHVVERFMGVKHVSSTDACSLKEAVDNLFSTYGLSLSSLRGQGYGGASNMQGEFNGLKAMILKENSSSYYVHCFAHQLQLALVSMARNHTLVSDFFNLVSRIVNVVGASCKRRDLLREKQADKVVKALNNNEISSGKGLNQEVSLQRAADTRWGSHYGTLLRLRGMFSSTIDVLEDIEENGYNRDQKGEALNLLKATQSFEFVFILNMMISLLGITNDLSQALQRKDQDIVNAMKLVTTSKKQLQTLRDNGWNALLTDVSSFCATNFIDIPHMDDPYVVVQGRRKRRAPELKNSHFYQFDLLCAVIDTQVQELNGRFNEVNTELLITMACLSPCESFVSFDTEKLVQFAHFYPQDFSDIEYWGLPKQLDAYFEDVISDDDFSSLKGIGELAEKMVKTRKHIAYPLVYRLVEMALILPVATASVERVFSSMKIVKSRLRNRMDDQWLNDSLVTYIEKEVFNSIPNDDILVRFQNMTDRRGSL